jgi:hypothetical protein
MHKRAKRIGLIAVIAACLALVVARPALAAQSLGTIEWIASVFAGIALYIAEVIGKLVVSVLAVVIPVMQYQGFTTSQVVISGWAIVRDMVNMFFVVVLIIIAMGTIFGHSRFQWKQQVPKLMIFAVVINFSKTLCGLMIDFAQVIMLTFANALKDIAGGNFIQLLGLGDIFSLSEKAPTVYGSAAGTGPGASPFDWFASGVAAVLMMVWVLAVVVMLLLVLIYRVVMLWILIVISPLAWFMGGQSVFKSDAYGEWWKNFICYTAIGPVITFFLWLTLAVAGSGFIAANDPGLTAIAPASDPNANAADFVTKIFEWQRLTSFVIGMAMLMVGFDAASKICSGVKGPGFQAIMGAVKTPGAALRTYARTGKMAYRAGKPVAEKVGAAAAGVGAAGLALAGGAGLAALAPTAAGQAARAKGLRELSRKGFVPTKISRALARAADERQKDLAERVKKAGEETFKGMSSESKVDYLKQIAKGGRIPVGEKDAALGLMAEAMQDPKMREKLEAAGVLDKLYKDKDKGGIGMSALLKERLKGTEGMKAIEEFEAGRPDITGNFGVINTMDDVNKIDPTALAKLKDNEEFKKRLGKIKSTTLGKNGEYLNAVEYFDQGHGGAKRQAAWTKGMTGVYEGMSKINLDSVPAEELAKHASADLVRRRQDLPPEVMAKFADTALLADNPALVKKMAQSNNAATFDNLAGNPDAMAAVLQSELGITMVGGKVTGFDADKFSAGMRKNPALVGMIPPSAFDPSQRKAVVSAMDSKAMTALSAQYRGADPARRAQIKKAVENLQEVSRGQVADMIGAGVSDEDRLAFGDRAEEAHRAGIEAAKEASTQKFAAISRGMEAVDIPAAAKIESELSAMRNKLDRLNAQYAAEAERLAAEEAEITIESANRDFAAEREAAEGRHLMATADLESRITEAEERLRLLRS